MEHQRHRIAVIALVLTLTFPTGAYAATLDNSSVLNVLSGILTTFSHMLTAMSGQSNTALVPVPVSQNVAAGGNYAVPYAAAQRIDNLSNVTVNHVTGLTASDIPSLPYLSTSGGALTGDVSLTNATSTNFFATIGHFTTGIIDTLTATAATITNLIATTITGTNATFANATTTNATSTNLYASNLKLGTPLSIANGGMGTTTWLTNSIPYFNGTYFTSNNANFNFNGTTLTAGNFTSSGILGVTGLSTLGGFLSTASSTITAGLFSMNGGASTTNFTASGTGYFGNVGIGTTSPSMKLSVAGNVYLGSGFSSNGTLVAAAPYATVASGSANFGPTSGETSLEFVGVGHIYRIRQNGTVTQMKIYIPSTTGITGFYLKIWRQNGTTFDLVGTSNNLAGSLTAGQVNTLSLPTGIAVAEGDYIGARVEYSSASVQNFFASTAVNTTGTSEAGAITYSVTNTTPSSTSYDWVSKTAATNSVVLEEVGMAAPVFVTIGDSITSGLPASGSFSDNYTTLTDITASFTYRLGHTLNYTYQNAGVGSNRTNQMSSRFTTDVVNKSPKFVVIMGGVNDLRDGTSNTTIVANITSMLDAAHAAGITPIIVGVLPFRNWSSLEPATNAMLQQRDLLNTSLRTLVTGSTYNGYYVNSDSYVGQYYTGGDSGNLWALRTQYDSGDGLHPNVAGQARIAQAISDALGQTTTQSSATLGNLNILGDTTYSGDAPKLLQIDRNSQYQTAGSLFTISAGGASTASTNQNGGNLVLQSGVSTGSGASSLLFQTSGGGSSGVTDAAFATRMTILGSNGNIGIGTTTPGVKLQVANGSAGYTWTPNGRTALIVEGNNTSGTALTIVGKSTGNSAIFFASPTSESIGSIAYDHTTASMRFSVNALERLRITSAGLVGIGTTTPDSALSIYAASTPSLEYSTGASGYQWTTGVDTADGGKFKISSSTAVGANARFTIDGRGNVGIGTTNPGSLLDINYTTAYVAGATTPGFNLSASAAADSGGTTDARPFNISATLSGANNASANTAFLANAFFSGTATLTNLYGLSLGVRNTGVGTSTNAYGFSTLGIVTAGSITNNKNIWVRSPSVTAPGTMGTSYGLYLDAQAPTGVTTGYGIYQAGTDTNYFAGNIGIGTTTPSATLTVYGSSGNAAIFKGGTAQSVGISSGTAGPYIQGYTNSMGTVANDLYIQPLGANLLFTGASTKIGLGTSTPFAKFSIAGAAGGTVPLFTISTSTSGFATSTALIVDQNGLVGIGTTSPTTALQVNGVITPNTDNVSSLGNATYRWSAVYAANGTIQTSDQRLKSNVTDLNYGLSDVLKLRPVSFTWTAQPQQGTQLGFIAQEVQPLFPETVNVGDDANHTLGLTYTEFVPVIVKSIQQLAQQIGNFADSFTTKELTFTRATGDEITVRKANIQQANVQELCVGSTCLTESQVQALLNLAGQQPSPPSAPAPSGSSDASSTPDVIDAPSIVPDQSMATTTAL